TLSLATAGTISVTVNIAADANYNAASATQTITIGKGNRTVTITSAGSGQVGTSIGLTDVVSAGTGAATWSVVNGTGAANVSGTTLNLTAAGTVTVTVDIAADANYNAASGTQNFTINAANSPSITFNNITKVYGDPSFILSASSNSPGAFSYSLISSTPAGIVTVASNGQVTISGAGTATIQADQSASGSFAAGSATATLTINKATPVVSITSANSGVVSSVVSLTNSLSGGTGAITWSEANGTGSATLTGSSLTLNAVGTVTVTVNVAADANYNPTSSNQTFTITAAPQTPDPGSITASANPVTQGQTGVTFSVTDVPGTTYTWTYTGTGVTFSGNGTSTVTIDFGPAATGGTLTVTANDGSGPSNPSSVFVTVNPQSPTGLYGSSANFACTLFPNPCMNEASLTISSSGTSPITIRIIDSKGVEVSASHEYFSNQEIRLGSQLKAGVYVVYIEFEKMVRMVKLVKVE
ncbi:MAG: T9SS type A sorting domain-containing protein, partial [Cytophagaceae bacterium]